MSPTPKGRGRRSRLALFHPDHPPRGRNIPADCGGPGLRYSLRRTSATRSRHDSMQVARRIPKLRNEPGARHSGAADRTRCEARRNCETNPARHAGTAKLPRRAASRNCETNPSSSPPARPLAPDRGCGETPTGSICGGLERLCERVYPKQQSERQTGWGNQVQRVLRLSRHSPSPPRSERDSRRARLRNEPGARRVEIGGELRS